MFTRWLKHVLPVTAFVALPAGQAQAAPILFTDRTAWETAMAAAGSGLVTDPFDSTIANDLSITFDSGVVSTGVDGNTFNAVRFGEYVASLDTDGDNATFDDFSSIQWTFPFAIIGFGADFSSTSTGEGLLILGDFGDGAISTINPVDYLGGSGNGFLGIIGAAPFSFVTYQSGALDPSPAVNESWQADNLSFGAASASPVPEPTTLLLLGTGLGIAGLRRRMSRRS